MDRVNRLLTTQELADYLDVPTATIYSWRYRGIGPVGFRVGKHVRFRLIDVERWIDRMVREEAVQPGSIQPEWVQPARTMSDPPDTLRR
jgi:excisionase family DNA binding protein